MDHQSKMNRTIDRLGIVRILLVQVMVLLALAGSNRQSQPQAPVQTVKSKAVCAKKA